MAVNYDLTNTGPEVQERLDQVMPNKTDIAQEVLDRQAADTALQEQITAINNEIGESGQGGETINGRLDSLESVTGNKDYAPEDFSGLGRVNLGMNLVEIDGVVKNVLTQDMMPVAENEGEEDPGRNAIYVIQYDYDLNGQTIKVPSGSVLEFDGGSFKNGILVGNGTIINASYVQKELNVTIEGTFTSAITSIVVEQERWGLDSDIPSVVTDGFQNAFDFFYKLGIRNVSVPKGNYVVEYRAKPNHYSHFKYYRPQYDAYGSILLYPNTNYDFSGSSITMYANAVQKYYVILLMECYCTVLHNINVIGDRDTHDYSQGGAHENCIGIGLIGSTNCVVEDFYSTLFPGDGLFMAGMSSMSGFDPNTGCHNCIIRRGEIDHCRRQGITIANAFDTIIDNIYIHEIAVASEPNIAPRSAIDVEPWNETFVAELVENLLIKNCSFKDNNRDIILASSFNNNIRISNCIFEHPISEESTPVTNYPNAVTNTGLTPPYRNSYNNIFNINVYWDSPEAFIDNCTFKGDCIVSGPYKCMSNCTSLNGLYIPVITTGTSSYPIFIEDCKFAKAFIRCSNASVSLYVIGCIIEYCISGLNGQLFTYRNCLIKGGALIGGSVENCNVKVTKKNDLNDYTKFVNSTIDFTEMPSASYVYGQQYIDYVNCTYIAGSQRFNSNSKKNNIYNSTIILTSRASSFLTSWGDVIGCVIKAEYDEVTGSGQDLNAITAVNNTIVNSKRRTANSLTFGETGLVTCKGNVFIGDNLVDQNRN